MAGGSDAHGDFNYRRHGQPCSGQWCDTPVGDTAIGKPRNLLLVGRPAGAADRTLPDVRRHTNRQVISSLQAGRFSVTDGPAVRIAVDRDRNGLIGEDDFQMGSTFHLFPGEHVPVLVQWESTEEFGRVSEIDLYVGTPERTFAAPEGARIIAEAPAPSAGAYAADPGGVLHVEIPPADHDRRTLSPAARQLGYRGIARFYLSPAQFDLVTRDGRLFYVRAVVKTADPERARFRSGCPAGAGSPGNCGGRLAFSNPIWGKYRRNCRTDELSLDSDGNRTPDTCERNVPDPCRDGSIGDDFVQTVDTLTVEGGQGGSGSVKRSPRASCQQISGVPMLPESPIAPGDPPRLVPAPPR